jgi:hypothetical protein
MIRKNLYAKIKKFNFSGRGEFETIFKGYSNSGSLATLAAFDMKELNQVKNPKVSSFVSLRLGDA